MPAPVESISEIQARTDLDRPAAILIQRRQATRHILTPEERARGHRLTREDRVKGGKAANRIRGARGGKAAHAKGTAHQLTAEQRRRGGLATAAKRRAKREADLIALALGGKTQEQQLTEIYLGASLADQLLHNPLVVPLEALPPAPSIDPFTLSALRRFRLGPISPFQLTRSQRAQVDLMREAGYIEATGDSMLQLASKGRQAIDEAEDITPCGADERFP